MALTDDKKAILQAYIEKGDRAQEPVFVGRSNLLDLVAANARAAARGDVEGRTVCIAGPPGIGKTAFLSELRRRAKADPEADPPMACVSVDPDCLGTPHLVMDAISKQLPGNWGPAVIRKVGEAAGRIRSLSFLGTGASWEGGGDPGEGASNMPWGALDQAMKESPTKGVICLIVDEAQGLADTPERELNVLLRSLHMGPPPGYSGPAVFAVLAGLSHVPDVIGRSISRMARGNQRHMPNLTRRESVIYVEHVLNHFEVARADPGRTPLAEWIVGECGGFPHHLRGAMESVADGLLDADSLALPDLDGALVTRRLGERRVEYYAKRAEGAVGHVKTDLGELLRRWEKEGRPQDRAAGQAALRRFIRDELDSEKRELMLESGVGNSEQLIDQMIRNGLLVTDRKGGGCRCPIDSLISWLESDGAEHAPRTELPKLTATEPNPNKGRDSGMRP